MMDSEMENHVKAENKLKEKVTELYAENKILESKISILNECLSLEKVKQKISDLENKQKMLKNLEGVVSKLKTDIKSLEYLKEILQKQLNVSSLSTDDYIVKELKPLDSSQCTASIRCAIETLDSLSVVSLSSEESVEIISDDDVFDDDNFSSSLVSKSQTFDEALLRASVVHSFTLESSVTSNGSTKSSQNGHPKSRDHITSMITSDTSEQFDLVNEQDLLNDSENDKFQEKCDTKKIESIISELNQIHVAKETFGNAALYSKECNSLPSTLLNSWVQVNELKSIKTPLKNKEQKCEDLFQAHIGSQKDMEIQKIDTAKVSDCVLNGQSFPQSESKDSNIMILESNYNNVDNNDKNINYDPVFSTNTSKYELLIESSMLNSEDLSSLGKCDQLKINAICEVPEKRTHVQIDQSCNQFESKKYCGTRNLVIDCKYVNKICNDKIETYNPVVYSNVQKYETPIKLPLFDTDIESSKLSRDVNNSPVNVNVEPSTIIDKKTSVQSCNQFESKEYCGTRNLVIDCKYVNKIRNDRIETYNPVVFSNVQKYEIPIKLPLFDTDIESSKLSGDLNNSPVNVDVEPSTIIDKKMSVQPCSKNEFNITDLNVDLLHSIHQHGYHNLSSLQLLFLYHSMSGQDIVFYSYPCVGKSTICIISVLQKINTGLNECQAIILVPTLVSAIYVQKMIKSLGKFLNVTTCVGRAIDFHEVSPVPHVVVSTPRDLSDMVNANLLRKDFIQMLVIDDADEILNYYGFSNQIRNVLLFLNNGCQLIVVSTSKLGEVLDHFSDDMKDAVDIIMFDEKPFLEGVSQYYVNVSEDWKLDVVSELYESLNLVRAVVYCSSWNKCLEIAAKNTLKKCVVLPVHKKMDAEHRQKIIEQFRSGTSKLLLTTELVKGEDFSDVECVINYDFPKTPEVYVHRIVGFFKHKVNVINFITLRDTMVKERIEAEFNKQMVYFPEVATDLCVNSTNSINDLLLSS